MKQSVRFDHILHLALLTFAFSALFSPLTALAGEVVLEWDNPNTQPELAGYRIYHGRFPRQYDDYEPIDVGNATTGKVANLDPGTWYFAVKAYGKSGEESAYSNEVWAVIPAVDTQPPAISGVGSTPGASSATIVWKTDEPSDSQVDYGMTTAYGNSTAPDAAMVTSHSQILTELAANTTYHYRVLSKDAAGNLAVSADFTFTAQAPPDTMQPPDPDNPGAPAPIDINTGLVAAYAFDEGTGSTSADLSGNGNTATINSAAWISGKHGQALSFNGTDSYVSAGISGMPGVNQPMTISCWIYLDGESGSFQSILAMANPELEASLKYGYKNLKAGVMDFEDKWMVISGMPSLGVWHHFGFVFDGSQNSLYIDGKLAGTSTIPHPAAPVTEFEIGRWVEGSEYFQGAIDEVRIYSRALSPDELRLAMSTPVTGAADLTSPNGASLELETAAQDPAAPPIVDLHLEQEAYLQGETVQADGFLIGNPSQLIREVELKTWLVLPGMLPISAGDLGNGQTINLPPGFSRDYGTVPLLKIAGNSPRGSCQANARLADPVTGDILYEDINPFAIAAVTGGHLKSPPATQNVPQEVPSVDLESSDSPPQCLLINSGATSATVEVKVWLEAPGYKPVPLFSAGEDESFHLPEGAVLTLLPLALLQVPAGTYVLKARALDPASGEILSQNSTEIIIP